MWDAASGKPVGAPMEHLGLPILDAAFSPDRRTVLTRGRDAVRLWDAATGDPLATVKGDPLATTLDNVTSADFSPDGRILLTGSSDGTARLRDVVDDLAIGVQMHLGQQRYGRFSTDGRTVQTGNGLLNAATGKPLRMPPTNLGLVPAGNFSPDCRVLVCSTRNQSFLPTYAEKGDSTVLWDVVKGEPIGIPIEHGSVVWFVAFGPDGRTILIASRDNAARLWDVRVGNTVEKPLRIHLMPMRACSTPTVPPP